MARTNNNNNSGTGYTPPPLYQFPTVPTPGGATTTPPVVPPSAGPPNPNDPNSGWYPPGTANTAPPATAAPTTPEAPPASTPPAAGTSPALSNVYEWIRYYGAKPGSDPSALNDTGYWVGAINGAGGLNADNAEYWQYRINSDPNGAPGTRGYYDDEDARRSSTNPAPPPDSEFFSALYGQPGTPGGVPTAPATAGTPTAPPAPSEGEPTPPFIYAAPPVVPPVPSAPDTGETPGREGTDPLPSVPVPDAGTSSLDPNQEARDEFIKALLGRLNTSETVNPFDPIIANQTNAYSARRQAASGKSLREAAEAAGPYSGTNLSSEKRNAEESAAQDTASFEGALVSNELTARRNQIQSALSGLQGYLGEQDRLALEKQLATINNALQQQQLKEQGREFDTTNTRLGSQFTAGLNETTAGRLQQNNQFFSSLSAQEQQFLKALQQRAFEFDTSGADSLFT